MNHKDIGGKPFWTGIRRCPVPFDFDPDDEIMILFVSAFANLLADTLGIP